jgi:hypothetical protein
LILGLASASGGGKKDPAKIAAELEKIQEQALEAAESGDTAKITKLAAEAAKLAAELEKAQTAAADKPAKAGKVVTGGKEAKETDFIYELNKAGDGVIITGYQKDAAGGALVIPAKIEGYPVVAIRYDNSNSVAGKSFTANLEYYVSNPKPAHWMTDAEVKKAGLRPYVTSAVLPDSITRIYSDDEIGDSCPIFNGPVSSIVFPKNLKEIPAGFYGDRAEYLSAVKWPETLEIIGKSAFQGAGFTELVIPEGVKEIRDSAFSGCKNLTSVTIPASIERIGDYAFSGCPELATVKMPAKTIKYERYDLLWGSTKKGWRQSDGAYAGAFRSCPKLTTIAQRKAITDTGYTGDF